MEFEQIVFIRDGSHTIVNVLNKVSITEKSEYHIIFIYLSICLLSGAQSKIESRSSWCFTNSLKIVSLTPWLENCRAATALTPAVLKTLPVHLTG